MSETQMIAAPKQIASSTSLLTVIERIASNPDADITKLQSMLEMQERWEANQARKAYHEAFARFKAEAVQVVKNTEVKAGPLAGLMYANLYDVVNAVIPALSKHGLSHSWRLTKDEKDWMEVTCTIAHELGHSESVSMGAAPDAGPGRNPIQARGSAKSYLERYTLLAATGLAAAETDDDANSAAAPQLDLDIFDGHMNRIENAANLQELQKFFASAYTAAKDKGDKAAMKQFMDAKDKRKKELQA